MKQITLILCLLGLSLPMGLLAQSSTVRGTVIDQDSRQAMEGARVEVYQNDKPVGGAIVDAKGAYRIEGVPVGRILLKASFYGYAAYQRDNLVVTTGRELVHEVNMVQQSDTLEGVTVVASPNPGGARNPVSVASTRSISVDLAKRAAGAVDDPSRLVMGFPGVQAPQDNNSDLVIRGNSPAGLLWRLEDIDIPNPNHFARKGSSGGGITVFSAQLLDESDFSTAAWPAEYGNAYSGVFDVHFRKGNNEKRESRFRASLLGLDFATEGPIGKNGASYLVNYRYSTLGILNDLGFRLVGERIDNNFQDLSFKLHFPLKNNRTFVDVWGIGGVSEELWEVDKDTSLIRRSRDARTGTIFGTRMGASGLSLLHSVDERSYLKAVVAVMGNQVIDDDDTLNVDVLNLSPVPSFPYDSAFFGAFDREDYRNWRLSTHVFYNRKVGSGNSFRAGVMASHINFAFEQSRRTSFSIEDLVPVVGGSGSSQLLQTYARFTWKAGPRLTINPGVHAMYLVLNGTWGVDPRLSFKYQINENQSAFLAYGLHSSILPLGNYFTTENNNLVNQDLDMLRSHHLVAGYDWIIGGDYHVRVEGYFQHLLNVPISPSADSTYWLLNEREGYATRDLVSEGIGRNYGVDLTLEKYFRGQSFFLVTASLYQSLYATNMPDTFFNTRFNGNYSFTAMGGKEWTFKKGGILQLSTRAFLNGGLRYSPADLAASTDAGFFIPDQQLAFSERVGTYFRVDGKVSYRVNKAGKVKPDGEVGRGRNWQVYLEVQNVLNRLNRREPLWDPFLRELVFRDQAGLIPNIGFQIDF